MTSNTADNTIDGGAGIDTISYVASSSAVIIDLSAGTATGDGNDILLNIEKMTGSNYDDILISSSVNNTINGGIGIDTVSYASAIAAVTVSLTANTATGGGGSDTLSNIENIIGSSYNDTLTGNTANNTIDGGAGNDTLIGATGNDLYLFKNIFGNDIIRDTSGTDSIDLSDFILASVIFTRQEGNTTTGDDLFIDLGANGNILIENYFTEDSGSVAGTGCIENISFQDDSSVDLAQIASMGL